MKYTNSIGVVCSVLLHVYEISKTSVDGSGLSAAVCHTCVAFAN